MLKSTVIRRQLIDTLMSGNGFADLVLKNGRIINVLTREIYSGDVAIKGKYILKVGDCSDLIREKTVVHDLGGSFVSPGFIDSHMHFESSMLTITEFSRLSIPSGTTTLIGDPHEIGNVLGVVGITAMIEEAKTLVNNVYLVVPCLTPDSPTLETAGYDITSKDMEELLSYPNVIGIGEMQGFSNARYVYRFTPEVIDDIVTSTGYSRGIGKIVDGNAPELFGNELAAHIICAGGDCSCHETTTKKEAIEKLRYGIYLFMREGSTQRNMAECIKAVTEEGMDSRRCILVTDDMLSQDLEKKGHMNDIVARTIKEGIDPVEAIQMVTINPASYFGLTDVGVLAPFKRADIAIITDLQNMTVSDVYLGGAHVAHDNKLLINIPFYTYPSSVKQSVKCKEISVKDLHIAASGSSAKGRAIVVIPDQNLTEVSVEDVKVQNNVAMPDLSKDVLLMACVERYGKSGSIGKSFVKNFGLKKGAFAESVAHDTHNIIVCGTNYEDMALAVNHIIKLGGGISVAKDGKIIAELALPVGGLITDVLSGSEVSIAVDNLQDKIEKELGATIHAPLMHLSFLALTTSPKWKITDKGLIDVENYKILEPILN